MWPWVAGMVDILAAWCVAKLLLADAKVELFEHDGVLILAAVEVEVVAREGELLLVGRDDDDDA